MRKKLLCCLMVSVMMFNSCAAAVAGIKISIDGEKFDNRPDEASQRIVQLFRELERTDEEVSITVSVAHGSAWSLEKGFDALKSYGQAGIDYLVPYGQAGLDYLKAQGGEGWKYFEDCGRKGLKLLQVCGKAGLEYLLNEGADGWEYLQRCEDAGIEFLKSLGTLALYLLLKDTQFKYFAAYLGEKGLEVLKPHALEALKYLAANGADAWNYLKDCGASGFEFLKSCGEAGLDYILSFGKAGLDYLMSFGEDGWNFLMSYYDNSSVINKLSGDIPALGKIGHDDERSVKGYLETYKELGRDVLENFPPSSETLDVLRNWTHEKKHDTPNRESIIEEVMPGSVNIDEASEVKRFIEADALEWIDFVPDFKDREFFREGGLTFCREYTNSLSSYGFADRDYLSNTLRKFYGGGFSLLDNENFTFRLSGSTVLWTNTIQSAGENAFFSLKTLRPGKGGDVISLALRLLQTVKNKNISSRHAVRLFFRTDCDWLRVVAVIREGVPPTYYLAGNRPLLKRNSLVKLLMDSERIELDASMDNLMFKLLRADSRVGTGADLDTCINVFIEQILGKLEEGR